MVDGRFIMRDGRVLTLDERAIVAEAERIARAAWGRLFKERPESAASSRLRPPSQLTGQSSAIRASFAGRSSIRRGPFPPAPN